MKEQTGIPCRCAEGRCFLEEDTAWAKRNTAEYEAKNDSRQSAFFLNKLDAERLLKKSEWMDALGVNGTSQICCRQQKE